MIGLEILNCTIEIGEERSTVNEETKVNVSQEPPKEKVEKQIDDPIGSTPDVPVKEIGGKDSSKQVEQPEVTKPIRTEEQIKKKQAVMMI